MPRIKIGRKSTAIDMTAMCDVAFLLLTFFILTATARQVDPLPVDIPSSTTQAKLPDLDVGTISIGDGKVFMGISGQHVREAWLEKVGANFGQGFSASEKKEFSLLESFGVPIQNMHEFLAADPKLRAQPGFQPGIPLDTVKNELFFWIIEARRATKEAGNDMRIAIKGDIKQEYPLVKEVIEILQKQKVNNFSLITALEAAPKK